MMDSVFIQSQSAAAPAVADQYATVSLAGMRLGATLRAPIYEDRSDNSLVLLLSSGTTLTESLLSRLRNRGISSVRVHRSELRRVTGGDSPAQRSHRAQQAIERAQSQRQRSTSSRWACSPESFVHKVASHGASTYDAASQELLARNFSSSVTKVETLFEGLSHGQINDAASLAAVSSESLLRIADDLDLFVALGLTPATDRYPCKHSLQAAMIAMSIGTILGLKSDELIELGIGCLVHDAGMLQIQSSLVSAQRPLNKIEFLEITKHPTLTFDALRDVKDVPNGSRLVAYQMHERLDGSGYPRRRTGNQIHYLAKIAAVADVFIALLSPRPHRAGLLPYHAMEQILHGARQGLYDPTVVRALLHTVSLFPIGSYVEVNDGRVAKVVRSNRDAYALPVIEMTTPNGPVWPFEVIDLRQEKSLKIVRPVASASAGTRMNDEG